MYMAVATSLLFLHEVSDNFIRVITLALPLVVLGVLDDRFTISATRRFLFQIVLTLTLIEWTGFRLVDLGAIAGGGIVTLGLFAVPMTVISVVGVINAVNFSDGLDGLAGGQVLVALMFLAISALGSGQPMLLNELLLISGAVLAFLLFNGRYMGRHQAKIFMGDAGSMLLGFLLAWYFISMSQGENRVLSPVTALWFFALPLFDTVGIMLRRVIHGRSPFSPDREHLHHILLRAGLSVRTTVALMMLMSTALAMIGLLGENYGVNEGILFWSFLTLFAFYFFVMMHAWKAMRWVKGYQS
jgi:UDP-GlcNAc:undecaprenyl-phosphate GlcNAc-1-phosphate transferase